MLTGKPVERTTLKKDNGKSPQWKLPVVQSLNLKGLLFDFLESFVWIVMVLPTIQSLIWQELVIDNKNIWCRTGKIRRNVERPGSEKSNTQIKSPAIHKEISEFYNIGIVWYSWSQLVLVVRFTVDNILEQSTTCAVTD